MCVRKLLISAGFYCSDDQTWTEMRKLQLFDITTHLRSMQFFIQPDFSTFPIPYFRLKKHFIITNGKKSFSAPLFHLLPLLLLLDDYYKNSTLMGSFAQSKKFVHIHVIAVHHHESIKTFILL